MTPLVPWRNPSLIVAGAALVLIGIYSSTAGSLWAAWSKDPLGHGYVVVPAALYLVWTRRSSLSLLAPRPAFWLIPVLALFAGFWLLGNLASSSTIQQLCLVLMFVGVVWGTLGTAVVRTLMLPLGLLVFALPVGDLFVPALQGVTARTAVSGLQATGVPAHLQGTLISVPGSSWDVARACSGINYLMSSLVIAYLYAGLVYRSWINRVLLVALAVPVALFANALRVYVTILAASLGADGVASGLKHDAMGWIVFTVILWAMLGVSRFLPDRAAPVNDGPLTVIRPAPAVVSNRPALAFVAIALLVVGVAPLSARQMWLASETTAAIAPIAFEVSPPWVTTPDAPADRVTGFPGASAELVQRYERRKQVVRLDVAQYQGANGRNSLALRPGDFRPIAPGNVESARRRPITINGQTFDVHELTIESGGLSTVEWTWYSVDGVFTSGLYRTKLLQAKSRLLFSRTGAAAFRLSVSERTGDRGVAILEDFIAHLALDGSARTH